MPNPTFTHRAVANLLPWVGLLSAALILVGGLWLAQSVGFIAVIGGVFGAVLIIALARLAQEMTLTHTKRNNARRKS
ncbi:hypothetical protein ACF8OH_03660 [Delftia sp. WSY_9]|nr:hypothetical protein HQS1_39350 [Delftia lacustris]